MAKLRDTAAVIAGVSSVVLAGAAASVVLTAVGSTAAPDSLFRILAPPMIRVLPQPTDSAHPAAHIATAYRENVPIRVSPPPQPVSVPQVWNDAVAVRDYTAAVNVDDYYVAANVASSEPAQVDLAVTTNVFDVVPEVLRRIYDQDPAANGPTTIRTEQNFHAGTFAITLADREIGTYTVTFDANILT